MSDARFEVLRLADQPVQPWKNGGGTTREVAVAKHADGAGFRWRISVAQVASDGPFSLFPGIDRTLWLLRGAGMILDIEGGERRIDRRLDHLTFAGEARIACRLIDGPNEDLNLMVERASTIGSGGFQSLEPQGTGSIRSLDGAGASSVELVVLVLRSPLRCVLGGDSVQLRQGDALHWRGAPSDAIGVQAEESAAEFFCASFHPRERPSLRA